MRQRSSGAIGIAPWLVCVFVFLPGCHRGAPVRSVGLEQHSLRFFLTAQPDGTVDLAEHPPLLGRIDLKPILEAEGAAPAQVELLIHAGRLYLWGDGFRNVWELTQKPGSSQAGYRPAVTFEAPPSHLRLSHYAGEDGGCVRMDALEQPTAFLSAKGDVLTNCP